MCNTTTSYVLEDLHIHTMHIHTTYIYTHMQFEHNHGSYLVGVRTRAKRGEGLFSSACKIGRAKEAVLPDPVSASPIMSRSAGRGTVEGDVF